MIDQFITQLNQWVVLDASDEYYIRQNLKIRHFKKKELILREGQISKAFYFNLKGVVRLFYLKGVEERTCYFYPVGTFISAYESFTRAVPSKMNLQAMTDCALVEITVETAAKLLAFSPKFEALARIGMEQELIVQQEIIASLLMRTPEERYAYMLEEHADLFQDIPQHYIASYIGVQPESLSRIKKRHYLRNLNQRQGFN